jgi:hypothetical protein
MGPRSREGKGTHQNKKVGGEENFNLYRNDGWMGNDCVFEKIVLLGCWGICVFSPLMWRIPFPGSRPRAVCAAGTAEARRGSVVIYLPYQTTWR